MVRYNNPSPERPRGSSGGGGPLRRGRHRIGLPSDAVGLRHQSLEHLAARGADGFEPQLLNGDRYEWVGAHRRISLLGRLPGPQAVATLFRDPDRKPRLYRTRRLPGCIVTALIGEWA